MVKTWLKPLAAGVIFLSSAGGTSALAQDAGKSYDIGGTEVTVPLPNGMCMTSRRHPRDRALHEYMDRANGGRSRILMIMVSCDELRAFRSHKQEVLRNYGMSAIPTRMIPKMIKQPRPVFVRQMTDFFRRSGMAILENRKDKFAKRIENALPGLTVNQQKFLGVLHSDDQALHLGFLQKLTFPTIGTVVVTGVFSMTVLKGKMIGLYRYKHYKGLSTVADLMNLQKRWVKDAIKANARGT